MLFLRVGQIFLFVTSIAFINNVIPLGNCSRFPKYLHLGPHLHSIRAILSNIFPNYLHFLTSIALIMLLERVVQILLFVTSVALLNNVITIGNCSRFP